jgi:uncharacterized protein (TIGR02452 family)
LKAYLSFENTYLRGAVDTICLEAGFQTLAIPPFDLIGARDLIGSLIIYETSDDAARLAMLVYELYAAAGADVPPTIIGIVSNRALDLSPSLGRWLIDGHSAIAALHPNDENILTSIRQSVARARRSIIAADTMHIINTGTYVADTGINVDISGRLAASISNTRVYRMDEFPENLQSRSSSPVSRTRIQIQIWNENVVTAIIKTAAATTSEEVVCLNFTTPNHRGGTFLGTSYGQELSLLSASGLYACLRQHPEFFEAIRAEKSGLYNDTLGYSSGVPVFRGSDEKLLPIPPTAAFISAVPVCARRLSVDGPNSVSVIRRTMERRVSRLLWVAAERGHRTIVLGAWGCGGAGNDPDMIADMFANELIDNSNWTNSFITAIFAIDERAEGKPVLAAFHRRFASAIVQ